MRSSVRTFVLRLALPAAFTLALPMFAQQTTSPSAPPPITNQTPVTPGQTANSGVTGAPLSKSELKAQKKQQKADEKAAEQSAKAQQAKAKALKQQDKANSAAEKATSESQKANEATQKANPPQ